MGIVEDISKSIINASTSLSDDKLNALNKAIEIEENKKPKPVRPEIIECIESEEGFGIDFIDDNM